MKWIKIYYFLKFIRKAIIIASTTVFALFSWRSRDVDFFLLCHFESIYKFNFLCTYIQDDFQKLFDIKDDLEKMHLNCDRLSIGVTAIKLFHKTHAVWHWTLILGNNFSAVTAAIIFFSVFIFFLYLNLKRLWALIYLMIICVCCEDNSQ